MKKIIYSLVIMIAAGSLFTSCVNYEEPVGVQDLREAKASYLDALSALRAADATVREAEATYKQAEAKLKEAEAKVKEAEAKKQEIANDKERALADEAIAAAKERAEIAAEAHKQAMAKYAQALEELQKQIAAESLGLTAAEKKAVQDAINYYTTALGLYNTAADKVATAEQNLFIAENGFGNSNQLTEAKYIDSLKKDIEKQKDVIAKAQATIEAINSNETLKDWEDYLAELQAEKDQNNFLMTQYKADSTVIASTDLVDAQYNANAEVAAWLKANTPKLTEKEVKFTDNKGLKVDVLSESIWFQGLIQNYANQITSGSPFAWTVNTVAPATVDAWLNGVEDATNLYQQIGFNGIIKTVEDSKILEPDTTTVKGLEAISVELDSTYKAHLDIIKAGRKAFLEADADSTIYNAAQDTLEAYDAFVEAEEAYEAATAAKDSIYTADSTKAANLFDAREALAQAAKDINEEGIVGGIASTSYSSADVEPLLAAVKAFVAAKKAVIGPQSTDTLSYYKEGTLVPTLEKVAIAALEASDLVQTIDSIKVESNQIRFKVSNQFTELKPYQSESVRGGFVDNSYEVVYAFPGTFTATEGWIKYADSLATKYSITTAALANARLSKPAQADQYDEVFTVIFKALGLVPSFWYSDDPYLTEGSQPESNAWYDNITDGTFIFNLDGSDAYVNMTSSVYPSFGPFYLVYNDGTDKKYEFADYKDAVEAEDEARTAKDEAQTDYDEALVAFAQAVADVFNAYATISNNFYGYVRGTDDAFIENEFTADGYKNAMTATEWAAWDENKKAEVEQFEYCVSKLDSYVEYTLEGVLDVNGELAVVEDLLTQGGAINDIIALKAFVFGNNNNSTEYAKAKIAEFKHKIVSEQKDAVEYFSAFKAWVKGLEDALVAANDANKAYYEAWDEFAKKFYGRSILDKKGQVAELALAKNYSNILTQLNQITIIGVYDCSYYASIGYVATGNNTQGEVVFKDATEETSFLAELYEKYFAELDETLYELGAYIEYFGERNDAIEDLMDSINTTIVNYLKANDSTTAPVFDANDTTIADAVKALVDNQINNVINPAKDVIASDEWALTQLAAGVTTKQVAVAQAERALEAAQAKLAAAEEVLAIAKAQYDAVIAKYVK